MVALALDQLQQKIDSTGPFHFPPRMRREGKGWKGIRKEKLSVCLGLTALSAQIGYIVP